MASPHSMALQYRAAMRLALLLLSLLATACGTTQPTPTAPHATPSVPQGLPDALAGWAEGGKDMVWAHTRPGPPPDLPLERFERCGDFGIAFFDASNHRLFIPDGEGGFIDDNLLWAAGSLRESPQGADGGFVATPEEATLDPYRSQHGPCEVVFRR